jgi:hypothetical protein
MDPFTSDLVRKLRYVENQFIQVLVHRFKISRGAKGVELTVRFSEDAPTISTRRAKARIQTMIPEFSEKSAKYQAELEAFFLGNASKYEHQDIDFPFRFASGGTLPIIRSENRDYYCLFYRDIRPVGWNIANGGCATRAELLDPLQTVYRELCEELIIVNRHFKERYIYGYPDCQGLERESMRGKPWAPCAPADLWHMAPSPSWLQIFPELTGGQFRLVQAPMKWLNGPDSLYVQIDGVDAGHVQACYVNINATDFGIEIDKVARINLSSRRATMCDGEQTGRCIVNRLIGLFETEKLNKQVAEGSSRFVPDKLFFNAEPYDGDSIDTLMRDQVLPHLQQFRSAEELAEFDSCTAQLDLCPVTRSILRRIAASSETDPRLTRPSAPVDVFISYGGDDDRIARTVYHYLDQSCNVFFFPNFAFNDTVSAVIDEALESARYMIVVCAKPENLLRDHCEYEWRKFLNDVKYGFKHGVIVPFVEEGVRESNLPEELQAYAAEKFKLPTLKDDLSHLATYRISEVLRRAAAAASR